ncbi:two-component system nitrogen regulation response regulator NtrX [Roseiarcus fermentans]|uniref:Two-component system nitrogen regulation response regulator NtrX n=1 Tax=Roseiarcus fermentans TaxID=1473586 RepID=A0A366FE20_9HYPH|nr:sigma-54 dependent transcriptional regulator [Roseiarcus fermentans]RBP12857.1 two-component system nitrogen regulation response regulator NtrX [Roseiarcus fermentans]
MAADILIVDDEEDIRELVAGILEDEGHQPRTARNSDEALAAVESRRPQLILLDIWLQGSKLDGLQLLEAIKAQNPTVPVVMISGHGNIETAVTAIKLGAYDFIEKPFKADRLILIAERALETSRLKREVQDLRTRGGAADRIVGSSSAVGALKRIIEKLAPANSRVLISGGAGSGKELAARLIHERSGRADGPFVVLNAPAMSPDTMEAELFGVEEGPGRARRIGALEEAHGGTLYLDEVADMPRETQAKILRVLVDQNFQRVGGASRVHVDVRIISSTSQDLAEAITEGRFREDLFHRLSVVPIRVPTLAERREDIPELVQYFMERTAANMGVAPRRIGGDAMAVLQSHDWPGNIRQLRNNVERLMILALGDPNAEISAAMLPAEVGALVPAVPSGIGGEKLLGLPLREAREAFERDYLIAQLNRFGGNISRTAEFIGMERSALHRKLKSLGVES